MRRSVSIAVVTAAIVFASRNESPAGPKHFLAAAQEKGGNRGSQD